MDRKSWLSWRHKGIGASDAPIVLGTSKFKTPIELYEQKILEVCPPEDKDNEFIKAQGNMLETKIRALVEILYGQEFAVKLKIHGEYPWMLASLDGESEDEKFLLEIKLLAKYTSEKAPQNKETPGYKLWLDTKEGKIPEQYVAQVMHQLEVCSNAEACLFVGLNWDTSKKVITEDDLAIAVVQRDRAYIDNTLMPALKKFRHCVENKIPPAASKDDFVALDDSKSLFKKWIKAKLKADTANNALSEVEAQLKDMAEKSGHPKYEGEGVQMKRSERKGSISYSKVVADLEVDKETLEKYRGAPSVSWKIELI